MTPQSASLSEDRSTTQPRALNVTSPARAPRVQSIDILRGITIAFMILVNDPGDWSHTYAQLDHAKWNGWTLTDLVFPNFLFLVGAAIILSLNSRLARGDSRRSLGLHILRRAVTIFALKMFLTMYPHFHMTHLRIYGVLTRIAICYLCVGFICLATQRAHHLLAIAAVLLIGYWVLMRFVPVPGFGVPTRDIPLLDPDGNLTAWLDRGVNAFLQRTIHTGVLYQHTRDPEGLLSTIPAIATTLLGSVAAIWLRRVNAQTPTAGITPAQCSRGLFLAGFVSLAAGLLWNLWFPINKNLWTSSYVLFAAGCSLLGLAICYWLVDVRHFNETKAGKWLTWPWLVFGSNAIVAFFVSDFIVETMIWIKVPDSFASGKPVTAWYWVYYHIFARNYSNDMTSLAFALAFVALCFLPNLLLWRKRIFIKI
jgi:predicted acyltransferase